MTLLPYRPSAAFLAATLACFALPLRAAPGTALITFSGVYNGSFPWADTTVVHRPMPAGYQPLLAPSPDTKPVDGGDLRTRITWQESCVSNHSYNANVFDHTGDYRPGSKAGGGVLFGTSPFAMTFSQPVEIPSLYWTYYIPTAKSGTISVFRHAGDTTPLKTAVLRYGDNRGYVWRELTAFAGLEIERIEFEPGDETHTTGLNIDDMTLRARP